MWNCTRMCHYLSTLLLCFFLLSLGWWYISNSYGGCLPIKAQYKEGTFSWILWSHIYIYAYIYIYIIVNLIYLISKWWSRFNYWVMTTYLISKQCSRFTYWVTTKRYKKDQYLDKYNVVLVWIIESRSLWIFQWWIWIMLIWINRIKCFKMKVWFELFLYSKVVDHLIYFLMSIVNTILWRLLFLFICLYYNLLVSRRLEAWLLTKMIS